MQRTRDYSKDPVSEKNYKIPSLELGQAVKIICQDTEIKHKKTKIFKGNIIFINSKYLIVKGENYKESFMLSQFRMGEVRLLNA
jgi:ribosomal protein L19